MNIFSNVDQNIYYSILLVVVMIITTRKLPHKNRVVKTINIISVITIIAAIGEGITENGILQTTSLSQAKKIIYYISSTMTAALALILSASWLYFVYLYINRYKEINEKVLMFIIIPVGILLPIIITTPFSHSMIYLKFTENGMIYDRGPLYALIVVFEVLYILGAAVYVFKYRKELNKTEFVLLLLLEVMPTLGITLQMLFPHLLYIFSFAIFTILLTYLLLREKISDRNEITFAKTADAFYAMLRKKPPHNYNVAYIKLSDYVEVRKQTSKNNQTLYLKKFARVILDNLESGIDLIYISDCKFVLYFQSSNKMEIEKFIYKIRDKLLTLEDEQLNYKFDFNITSISKEKYDEEDVLKRAYIEFYENNKEVVQC